MRTHRQRRLAALNAPRAQPREVEGAFTEVSPILIPASVREGKSAAGSLNLVMLIPDPPSMGHHEGQAPQTVRRLSGEDQMILYITPIGPCKCPKTT